MRLSTIALQHGLRANDLEVLRSAVKHWDHSYVGIHKAPNGADIQTYLLALRRLGQELPEDLVNVCSPEIQAVLRTET